MMAGKSGSGLKCILAILFILLLISSATAFEFSQLQWDKGVSGTLKRDEVISYLGYSVKVIAFNAPVESDKYRQIPVEPVEAFVGLDISKNGNLINTTMLRVGESFILPDGELKVTATELPSGSSKDWLYESYNPWVKLEINPRGKPRIDLLLDMDEEYMSAPNTEILVNVVLKNTGAADVLNVDMDIGTDLPLIRGDTKYHYEIIKKGSQVSETLTFSSPVIKELKSYDIFANVSGFDVKGISYTRVMLKKIFIAPPPQQLPSFKKSSSAKMYLKDITMVSISFKNNMNTELKNVSITDYVPKGFKQISNNSLHWVVNVPADGEWYFRYLLKPTEADKDGVIFPAAKAEFKIKNEFYAVQSNRPETIVYGPRIDLTKQADVQEIDPYGTFTVTVIAVNKGSTPSKVTIEDSLPDGVTLISGSTKKEEYMEAGKETRISYTIRSDSDKPVMLPAATADYFELGDRGAKLSTRSQELSIRIKPPPTPEPTPQPTVEISQNYTDEGTVQTDEIPANDITEPSEQPVIIEPEQEKYSIDRNAILNLLLGCNDINGEDSRINMTSDVCDFVLADASSMEDGSDVVTYNKGKSKDTPVAYTSTDTNLVPNPGFESGSNTPLSWTFMPRNGNTPSWDGEAHSGSKSVKISIPGTIDVVSGFPKSDIIIAKAATTYTLSAWGKTQGAGGKNAPVVRVVELDANQNSLRQTNLPEFGRGTNDWTQNSADFKTGSSTAYLYVYANIWNGYGTFWVDDVELSEKTPGRS